ncbi:hypothetical protein [Thalassoroseus pseudoceratinae]|uniref:hypothetical protein n=1 Tax=Thalassoroseus pseudoceratinae TaxID=2713176 RepID=UPI001423797A|nr:hypothetical protein [Thalassoroseus pseudoceratinae]
MTSLLCLTAALLSADGAADANHIAHNPVYAELRQTGLTIGEQEPFKLPAPMMDDNLTGKQQKKIMEAIGGRAVPLDRLTRKALFAPHILKRIKEVDCPKANAKAKFVNVYFVAYGDFDELAKNGKAEDDWKTIDEQDLQKRGIDEIDPKHERYGHIQRELINRVMINAAVRTYWSQTDDSLVFATQLAPQFNGDSEFPNYWQSLVRNKPTGEKHPYEHLGMYIKVTKLKDYEDGLFIEVHVVFSEPEGWFDGRNLLISKLPQVVQSEVRDARGDMKK